MKINLRELKKRAIDNLKGKWKICVLGNFVPFILFLLMFGFFGITTDGSGAVRQFLICVIYAFISFSFSVGISSVLLVDVPKDKYFPKTSHFLIMSFLGLGKAIVPVFVTKIIFMFSSYVFSGESLIFLYDNLFFSYFPYYAYLLGTNFLNVLMNFFGLYIALGSTFVPFLIADNPFLDGYGALKLSFRILKGHKMKIFLIMLSMIGWYFLGTFAFFVGVFFAMAYTSAVMCEYYKKIRPKMNMKVMNPKRKPL